ncbi:late control protein [Leptospira weilii]|uniref:late control protein n=1 Tax=Leptospira weilii TaxID=28184 RepID=UPI00201B4E08|nr:late control protein [Leptospira weilii]UPY76746.1 late control protein [Leptospira weilii]UPY79552.1 late control protein [Leptospira weilii]UPY80284.1 late control protein [Leptospira weilii]UPY80442.1 late control protein [Leptospira weilii]UPY80779.1 late control protein [Leptospira weilii]
MALIMRQRLLIGGKILHKISEAELISGRKEPHAQLTIRLPKMKGYDSKAFKKGDLVRWWAWYEGYKESLEFEGKIVSISPKMPLEIVCRDNMYDLQLKTVNFNIDKMTIPSIVNRCISAEDVIPKIDPTIASIRLSYDILTAGKRAAFVLHRLKKYGIDAFFRNSFLVVQNPTKIPAPAKKKVFQLGHNVIKDNLSTRESRPIQVKLRSYNIDTGKMQEATYTENGGEELIFDLDGISFSELKKRAEEIYHEIAGTGLVGEFETFGVPSVQHSEIITFKDPDDKARSKDVFVDKVIKTWSAKNATFRQVIHPAVVKFKDAV